MREVSNVGHNTSISNVIGIRHCLPVKLKERFLICVLKNKPLISSLNPLHFEPKFIQ
jgi:hypothetical protein